MHLLSYFLLGRKLGPGDTNINETLSPAFQKLMVVAGGQHTAFQVLK